jgi:hypothetical protein
MTEPSSGQTAGDRAEPQRQWGARHGSGIGDQPHHGNSGAEKKGAALSPVNRSLIAGLSTSQIKVVLQCVDAAEVDEMWSFVGKKREPCWLWHALDHHTGQVLAYVCGRRTDEVCVKLKPLLEPFGITRYYTDSWGPANGTSR